MPTTRQGRPAARSEQAAEEDHEQAGDDGDVEAGDGDDVGRAGVLESLLQVGGQAVILAEQDACQQRGFRVREDAVDVVEGLVFEGVDPAEKGIAALEGQARGAASGM